MSDYNQSQPLVMSSIKIGGYVLTEAELNKFVKLDSYRKIPSEYIGCDVRVNVYTLTEYAALQWIPHPSMGDVAIVFDSDENKACYNGTYIYQNPDIGNCIPPPSPCDVLPDPSTRVVNIANWKLVNPTISYDDIEKWNEYTETIGVIRQDITAIRTLVGTTEVSINTLTDNKINLAKTELTTAYKADDNVVRSEFAAADTTLRNQINAVDDKFDGEVARIDQNIIDFKARETTSTTNLQSQINTNIENIRLNTRDLGDLDTKFDRTVTAINTSVDQKNTLLNQEVTSKLTQNQSIVDGKIAAQDSKLTATAATLNDNITSARNTINNTIDSLRTQVNTNIDTLENQTETSIDQAKSQLQQQINTLQGMDTTLNTRITSEVATLNSTINTNVSNLNDVIDSEIETVNGKITTNNTTLTAAIAAEKSGRQDGDTTLNTRITSEVATLNSTINTNVSNLNNIINTKESALNTTIQQNDDDINYKVDQHTTDVNVHVTAIKQANWDAKIDTATLATNLATKANVTDVYNKSAIDSKISDLNDFITAKSKEYFRGFFTTTAELPLPGQQGWYAIVGTTDTVWMWDVETLAWIDSKAKSAVTSVNEKTGVVVLNKVDIGLAHVDNTSDEDKPVSNATNTALLTKVDKVEGKQLSTNDYDATAVAEVAKVTLKADKTYVDNQLTLKADKTYVDNLPSTQYFVGSFDTIALLPVDGNNGQFCVCKEDDMVYVWDQGSHGWKSALDKAYSKQGTDNLLLTKVDKVEGKQLSTNDYDATAVNEVAKVALKADKTYVDTQLILKADKTYTDDALALKANTTYVDTTIANLISNKFIGVFANKQALPTGTPGNFAVTTSENKLWVWNGNLDTPDWVTYYLTTDVDTELALKVDKVEGKQLSTNDYNAAAVAEVAKIAEKANIVDVNTSLASKANISDVTISLASKANVSDVNASLLLKADVSDLTTKADISYVNSQIATVTKFRGYFNTSVDINNISNPKNGDYAICNETNTVWYCKVVDDNTAPVWVDGDVNGEVTLTQFNTALSEKANVVDVYNKTTADGKFATITTVGLLQGQLDAKAIADQVYTITAADNKFVTLTTYNTFVGTTNATLDEKANETSVASRLLTKVDKVEGKQLSTNDYDATAVNEVAKVALKADKTYVDTQDQIITGNVTTLSNTVGTTSDGSSATGTVFARISKLNDDVLLRATITNVNDALALKVDNSYLTDALALKADKTYVDSTFVTVTNLATQLSSKANTTDVQSITATLANKVDTSTYEALVTIVNTKANTADVYSKTVADQTFATNSVVGTSADVASATGTLFARIAALEARIAALENTPTN